MTKDGKISLCRLPAATVRCHANNRLRGLPAEVLSLNLNALRIQQGIFNMNLGAGITSTLLDLSKLAVEQTIRSVIDDTEVAILRSQAEIRSAQ